MSRWPLTRTWPTSGGSAVSGSAGRRPTAPRRSGFWATHRPGSTWCCWTCTCPTCTAWTWCGRCAPQGTGPTSSPSPRPATWPWFAALREKLERYAAYRQQLAGDVAISQHEVDRVLATLRGSDSGSLPKGMSRESLDAVVLVLRPSSEGLSATEVAGAVGASRVTARRYLEYLADSALVVRRSRYGGTGRPEVEYHWVDR